MARVTDAARSVRSGRSLRPARRGRAVCGPALGAGRVCGGIARAGAARGFGRVGRSSSRGNGDAALARSTRVRGRADRPAARADQVLCSFRQRPGDAGKFDRQGTGGQRGACLLSPCSAQSCVSPSERAAANARGGLPTIFRHTDETDLPFAWLYKGYMFPSGAIIPPHVGVPIQLGEMWVENWKAAHSAQRQLSNDVAAIEFANDLEHAANAQVVDVLSRCVGQRLPVDREACRRWWFTRLGQTPIGRPERSHPTVTEIVRLDYLPRNVGGLGFDPDIGYYLIYVVGPGGR